MNQQATMGFITLLVLGLVLAGFSALATSTIKGAVDSGPSECDS